MAISVETEQRYKRDLYSAIAAVKSYSWFGRFFDKSGFIIDLRILRLNNSAVSQIIEHCGATDVQLKSLSLEADGLLDKYKDWLK